MENLKIYVILWQSKEKKIKVLFFCLNESTSQIGMNHFRADKINTVWLILGKRFSINLRRTFPLICWKKSNSIFSCFAFLRHRVDPPSVPYLGLYLSDLSFIEESSQDLSENRLINFSKMRMVSFEKEICSIYLLSKRFLFQKTHIISEIRRFQSMPFKIKHNTRVCAYLLDTSRLLTEDQCYVLSLKLEPRATRSGLNNESTWF